jgi:SAM-dependent methyltransferase
VRRDVLDLRQFYAGALGQAAAEMIGRKVVEAWGDAHGLDVLGLGYATPFLGPFLPQARRAVAAMPAQQGVEIWPPQGRNLAGLVDETSLPFANALFDRILVAHAMEEAPDALALLKEVWRVLSPSGRVIVAVAARNGAWANVESTPFGHGRPYSRRQLGELLKAAELEPLGWTRALYVPPVRWLAGWAEGFEQLGSRLWPPFAGVVLVEAVKETYAVKARGVAVRAPVRPGVLSPNPAGAAPISAAPSAKLTPQPLGEGGGTP